MEISLIWNCKLLIYATQAHNKYIYIYIYRLDADEGLLYSNKYKKYGDRDIVQFVEFRKVMNNISELRKETLKEIPEQVYINIYIYIYISL